MGSVCGAQGKCVPYLLDGGYPEFAKTPAQKQALESLWNAIQMRFSGVFANSCDDLWFALEELDIQLKQHPRVISSCESALDEVLGFKYAPKQIAAQLNTKCGQSCVNKLPATCIRDYLAGPQSPCIGCEQEFNPAACQLDCYMEVASGKSGCLSGTNPTGPTAAVDLVGTTILAVEKCFKFAGNGGAPPTATADEYLQLLGPEEWAVFYADALDVLAVALLKGCNWAHSALASFVIFQATGWQPWNTAWAPWFGYDKKFWACAWAWSHLAKQVSVPTPEGAIPGHVVLQSVGSPPGCPPKIA